MADTLSRLLIVPIELETLVDLECLQTLRKLYTHDAETGIIYTCLQKGETDGKCNDMADDSPQFMEHYGIVMTCLTIHTGTFQECYCKALS